MIRHSLCIAATAAVLAAQQVPEGLQATAFPVTLDTTTPVVLLDGSFAWFDGDEVFVQPPGQTAQPRLQLPATVFASFLVEVAPGMLLFGENSTNDLWLVPAQGPVPGSPLANVFLPYDAAAFDAQRAIVSARVGGFGAPDNDLVLVDLTTGALQTIARVPGASGPVAVADNGDVYYATGSLSWPTPPGQTTVLRFRSAVVAYAIQQAALLGIADAEVVFAGLDSAGDICLDDDGDLLFTDWFQNTVGELNDATGPSPWLGAPLIDYGFLPGAAFVQFVPGAGNGVFEPFQPAGGKLLVYETDYFSTSGVRFVEPVRATLSHTGPTPIPVGPVTFEVQGGPANGIGLLAIAIDDTPGSVTLGVGFEQPLHLGVALFGPTILWSGLFDAQGTLTIALTNPGFALPTTTTAQAVLLSTAGVLGSSTAIAPVFGQ